MRATSLIPGDLIVASLSAQNPNGGRIALSNTFDHLGRQMAGGALIGGRSLTFAAVAGAEPAFDDVRYKTLLKQNKKQEADLLSTAYKAAYDAWSNANNGGSIQDRIANAVLAFYAAEANVSTEDHDGPVIRADQVLVKPVERATSNTPGVFVVTLAPTWGSQK